MTGDASPDGHAAGLGWRTRVEFAVREDGVAGLRAHRSHEVIEIAECLIAHQAITGLAITGRRWPGAASVEALVAPASGERAVIVSAARDAGTRSVRNPSTRSRRSRCCAARDRATGA